MSPTRDGNRLWRALGFPFRFVGRLFLSDVKLKRNGKHLSVKVEPKTKSTVPDAKRQAPVAKPADESQLLHAELKKFLDLHPSTRRVMRHLVVVERALAKQGLQAMAEVPVEVLSVALEQLEGLVSNWSNARLAALRSKMSVAIVARSKDPFFGSSGAKPSEFSSESRLQVGDVSHSMFLEIERQYQGLVPVETLDSIRTAFPASLPTDSVS